jgi:hypothetical protein
LLPLLAGGRERRLLAGSRFREFFIRADIAFMTELA